MRKQIAENAQYCFKHLTRIKFVESVGEQGDIRTKWDKEGEN